jgi:hypothetical protein
VLAPRLRIALWLAALVVAGACSSSSPAAVTKQLSSQEPHVVTIAQLNLVSSTVGPVLVGEVRNVSGTVVGGVQVTAVLKDAHGRAMGQPMFGTTLLHTVPAGGLASFSIPFEVHGTVGSVSATVEVPPAFPNSYVPMTIASHTATTLGTGPSASYEVSGTVTNSSGQPVNYPNVVATFFDHSGNVVGAAHDVGSTGTVVPGGSSPFNIILLEEAHLVARYDLAAEGQLVAPGH